MQQQTNPCPMCTCWIYKPKLSIDYRKSMKNAKVMNHDECLDICKNEIKKQPTKNVFLLDNLKHHIKKLGNMGNK